MYFKVSTENRAEIFKSLSAVYGFLVGIFPNYKKYHPNVRLFKKWYRAKKRLKGEKFESQSKDHPFCLEISSHFPS